MTKVCVISPISILSSSTLTNILGKEEDTNNYSWKQDISMKDPI